ncbi:MULTISPECIES: flagellar motor stator protein MotA [Clostridium]|uniref:Motility protein A n=1 Tax=Clostridium saccharoperbutylacetonicum N1-4(HMT) TaxID=931276 RepID=M1MMX2_9CLOT|nr:MULTISPECIES: flagellar motor stator protein MotA [Clostridium]AGF59234.1 motility protein A [Clostridium saccharoperbutylacetonicum N1-4(HMT)]AQR97903.1 chemotaxis protein PomA [Clostridium saccharoperbutylacetonicum]NRT59979.1 chemotaxis protein MotA [Clostridium saccharoperbutylacetonicum]NSB23291.1 chemotaxis protein MotA [Clostridium saccharoperbutylacetonicum]NSB33795.1 chemotaxis protein MotA [Clostridium saccharoperbutylacetonicum]
MDIFLIIGMVAGLIIVVAAMLEKGASLAVLLSAEAFLVIIGGTVVALLNSFPKGEFVKLPKIFGVLFSAKGSEDPAEIIVQLVEMSQTTRRDGLLSLESTIQGLENKFMKKGLEMVVDGLEPDLIKEVLEIEIESMEERHRLGATAFSTAGGTAPTLGVLGAVIGLIGALGNLDNITVLGESIKSAFVATVFGIFTGYLIWHPFSNRLKRKSLEEVRNMNIMLEGILAIQAGNNPKSIERKLVGMLEPKQRVRFEENNNEN